MGGHALRVGRLFGIPIGIHPLWLLIVGLITWSLGSAYFPDRSPGLSDAAAYGLGLAGALGLFAGVLLHEVGHAVVARRRGIEVSEVDLWLLGGVAKLEGEAERPEDELRFAAAGPAVTAVLAAALGAVRLAAGGALPDWGLALLDYELYVSLAILGFNLLPAFPLDGGRIARAILWRRGGDRRRATQAAAAMGRRFGWGLLVAGGAMFVFGALGGLWFALVGWFLVAAATAEDEAGRLGEMLAGRTTADVMTAPAVVLPAGISVADAVVTGFARHLFTAFPVVDADGAALGLVLIGDVRAMPPEQRETTLLAAVAHRDPQLRVPAAQPAATLAADPLFRRVGRAVVVDLEGRPLGVVSVTDLERRLRADALLGGLPTPARAA